MSKNLQNKVAFITGSSRGIGKASALALARQGAALIGLHYANNERAAQETAKEIEALGTKVVLIKGDLSKGRTEVESASINIKVC